VRRGEIRIAGSGPVREEWFRYEYLHRDAALAYAREVESAGVPREMIAVTEWRRGITRRRSLEDLSPNTRRDYLGSSRAKEEARMNGFSVIRWYEVAPDLKAFRRKAPARRFTSIDLGATPTWRVYVSRDSSLLPSTSRSQMSAAVKAAWRRRGQAA